MHTFSLKKIMLEFIDRKHTGKTYFTEVRKNLKKKKDPKTDPLYVLPLKHVLDRKSIL